MSLESSPPRTHLSRCQPSAVDFRIPSWTSGDVIPCDGPGGGEPVTSAVCVKE